MSDITSLNSAMAGNAASSSSSGTGKKATSNWYEAMAEAWGQALDKQASKIQELGTSISDAGNDTPSQVTQLTAESLRMGFLANSSHTSLTSVASALETSARKQ